MDTQVIQLAKRIKSIKSEEKQRSYLIPFILITSLFFLWGFAISMLDVLNKHFQEALNVSRAQSGFIQFVVYGAYFLMALPAGYCMRKFGYKRGIISGLLLYAVGAFLFYPATIGVFGNSRKSLYNSFRCT